MSEGFLALIGELMAPLGHVSMRRMFGGHGVYLDGAFVAIVWKDQLYLKTDPETRPRFEERSLAAFRPSQKSDYSLGFHMPPEEALDDAEAFRPWAELALAAALRVRRSKRPNRRRGT
ncbi:MAG: TfoX/Sxy family protein [Proteobacteria bacterium]|nr:TfoX/Sxy family protein [Pseudomonadota bacterium]MBI3498677.1 TfoX/Sxy family protein [Pseudomonadota bacterium]